MDRSYLAQVVRYQAENNVSIATQKQYLCKVKVMTEMLNETTEFREDALITIDGIAIKHTGIAENIYVLKLPMSVDVGEMLFAHISTCENLAKGHRSKRRQHVETIVIDDSVPIDSNDPGANIVTVSAQTFQNYKSALRWWHEYTCESMSKIGHVWPPELDKSIKHSIANYKRTVGRKKRRGIMKIRDGKLPYNAFGYKTICAHFMKKKPVGRSQSWNEGLFASLFTKFSVNTIGRSDNIDDILTQNMNWVNDSLTISFGTTKADQSGSRTSNIKRIYANPFAPEVCLILDLAVFIWCKHPTSTEDAKFVFAGDDQEKRYYHTLVQAVDEEIDPDLDLGCARCDIGTHSNRKFAESTSVSKIDGPSRTQVCLRAGQGVGRTQDCYMFSEDDGDALVGRTVAQLKLNADEFDVLPPHFSTAAMSALNRYGWSRILPSYVHYSEGFQRVIHILFASLVYHFHAGNMHILYDSDHPIFFQDVFFQHQHAG
jgi:hypothetical protein